jgi:hypothetical protein
MKIILSFEVVRINQSELVWITLISLLHCKRTFEVCPVELQTSPPIFARTTQVKLKIIKYTEQSFVFIISKIFSGHWIQSKHRQKSASGTMFSEFSFPVAKWVEVFFTYRREVRSDKMLRHGNQYINICINVVICIYWRREIKEKISMKNPPTPCEMSHSPLFNRRIFLTYAERLSTFYSDLSVKAKVLFLKKLWKM